MKPSKRDFEEYLNEVGPSAGDLKSEGGRIPDGTQYGTWMRRHDPIAFNVGYREFVLDAEWRARPTNPFVL